MFSRQERGRSVPGVNGDTTPGAETTNLEIASRSGRVVVWARPVDRPEVLAGSAEVQPDGRVLGRGSDRVEVACPEGTDVVIGSSSGRVECHGRLGRVAVTSRSGRVAIEEAASVEVRTSSGRVTVGSCAGSCRAVVASGTVEVGSADSADLTTASGRVQVGAVGDAVVRAGSGRVELGLSRSGSVDVGTQSGRVTVTVPPGLHPALTLTSASGRQQVEVEPGSDGQLTIETSSGRIHVRRG
jgi:hypothetical protein